MKKLIIVRHGDYLPDGNLSEFGERQLLDLAWKINRLVEGDSAVLISSTAPRAEQSADLLHPRVQGITSYTKNPIFWSEAHRQPNIEAGLQIIEEQTADVVIIVTHFEWGQDLPTAFAERFLQTRFPLKQLNKAQAWVIDCEAKTRVRIPYKNRTHLGPFFYPTNASCLNAVAVQS